MKSKPLPAGFGDLQDLANEWSLAMERERQAKRLASSMQDLREFYDRMVPRAEAILEHIRQLDAGERPKSISQENKNLVYLLFSLAEVGQAVEVHGQPEVVNGFDAKRWVADHESPAWKAIEQRIRPTLL